MIPTTGISEVVLDVQCMDRMVRFYHEVIGLEIQYPRNVRSYAAEQSVTLDARGVLLTLRRASGRAARPGSPALVFGVSSLDTARLYLIERAVRMGEIYGVGGGVEYCDGFDPEGNSFSLVYHQPAAVGISKAY